MIKRVFAIVLLAVLASLAWGGCWVYGVTTGQSALSTEALQEKGWVVAPVNLPTTSDAGCSASVVVSVTVVNPDWNK